MDIKSCKNSLDSIPVIKFDSIPARFCRNPAKASLVIERVEQVTGRGAVSEKKNQK
jgi:hypothetical protein